MRTMVERTAMSHKGPKFGDGVIDCVECGFAHLDPIPSADELVKFYAQYYSKTKPRFAAEHEQDRAWWDSLYEERLALIESMAGGRRRLLDYGAGFGYFCEAAKDRGWCAYALEVNQQAAAACESRSSWLWSVAADVPPMSLDCIALFEVLEHVPKPLATLQWCARYLHEYGIIAIQVPNDFNALQLQAVKELGLPQYWIARPDHINYFTPQTLTSLLERAGFKIEYRCTSYPMESFLLAGLNYVEDAELGRRCHKARMEFDLALGRKERAELYQSLWDKGIGRDLFVIARKA